MTKPESKYKFVVKEIPGEKKKQVHGNRNNRAISAVIGNFNSRLSVNNPQMRVNIENRMGLRVFSFEGEAKNISNFSLGMRHGNERIRFKAT